MTGSEFLQNGRRSLYLPIVVQERTTGGLVTGQWACKAYLCMFIYIWSVPTEELLQHKLLKRLILWLWYIVIHHYTSYLLYSAFLLAVYGYEPWLPPKAPGVSVACQQWHCDALSKVLLQNLGLWHSWYYFDTNQLPRHCCRPSNLFHGKGIS